MMLSVLVFLPLAAGLLGALLPRALARWASLAGALGALGIAIYLLADFDSGGGLQHVVDVNWISELGISYSLGVDGLNLFLVVTTALLWVISVGWAAGQDWERPRLFYFHIGLAETAVLGAFLAQDVALFVVFFDLMLVPFYFLIGGWGRGERVAATTKLLIYTLVGSLLMLAAAVAMGVLATPDGGELSFQIADLVKRELSEGEQQWIFLLFALAFLVKAPAFPLHGWMPDAYRATPLPVLILLSAVLSKVGVYAFLRIVLPILPDASAHFQELMLVLAVISILYGSVLAFSQDDTRLVLGYSSIAQLGFITLGIFSLDPKGAQGAVFQMVNHALVTAALFIVVGVLAARARGSDRLSDMGGLATRAPVLAALTLILTLAALAMPGSGNFVGEFLILFGTFEDKIVYGLVASAGVVLAAVYMIRFFQRAMHYRGGQNDDSREIGRLEFAVLAPLVAIVIALGVYPQFVLERSDRATVAQVKPARELATGGGEAEAAPPGSQPVQPVVPPGGAPPGPQG
ncbi:MAG: NADH-quinone oxidoreductase subunit M, partial [Thermoleophilaceae bacterium]|nr:NADH-quinone oxidoreductase subunit M [Thermoleophilaceae bacterium]